MKKLTLMLFCVAMLLMVIGCSEEPMKPESNDPELNFKAITGISESKIETRASNKQAGDLAKSATSGLIDFEDLEEGQHQMFYHNPYHGMTFAPNIFHSSVVGYGNPVSGTKFLFNGWGYDAEYVTLAVPDELEGVWVGKPHGGNKTFWMEGYLGGTLVGQSSVITLSRTMQWLPANFGGQIDSIVFRINEPGGWRPESWWVLDDMTFGSTNAAPTISMNMEMAEIWPPNHKMVLVATGSATDAEDDDSDLILDVTVTSNEDINGTGDGNTEPDWEVVDNGDGTFEVWVRAERDGKGSGRTYEISAYATDSQDATSSVATGSVFVPKSKGK